MQILLFVSHTTKINNFPEMFRLSLPKKQPTPLNSNLRFRKNNLVLHILSGTHCIHKAREARFMDVTPNVGYSATICYIMHYTII